MFGALFLYFNARKMMDLFKIIRLVSFFAGGWYQNSSWLKNKKHHSELKNLLTLKFQFFEDQNVLFYPV